MTDLHVRLPRRRPVLYRAPRVPGAVLERTRTTAAWVAGGAVVVALLGVVGFVLPELQTAAVGAALLVLVVGLTAYEPVALPILAMPALVVVQRVGGGGVDLSLSDFALFGAFWFALFFSPRPFSRPMRAMIWLSVVYQVATLFTVIVNPFTANVVEWFHAWVSVAGALVLGWAVGRSGRARLGLTLFLAPCLAIAAQTCLVALQQLAAGNTGPVYIDAPIAMHKNFIGCVLAFAALTAYARPWWVGWPRWFSLGAFWLCSLGVLAAQARQALIGLAIGIMLITLRGDPDRKRSKLILLAAIPAIYFVVLAVQEQLASGNQFNSANQRLTWYADSIDVWQRSPWVGMGLRWWTAGVTEFVFQPPNVELEVLSSAGIVGLAGFLVLFLGGMAVLWRINPRFGTLAFSMLMMRFVQGQFDLFWVSVQVTVPFVIVGVCLGAEAYAESRQAAREETGRELPLDELRSVREMAER
ncbi:O-antigen ligase domain-containing protein [Cellulosimicrobium sp. BIT-GX5]|uniref:O-antigen ligase domain-containing protein n=1 Tax=Cellulosimicrobium composti TaxID=2672572 RepID=A0A6N7ZM28_9MICO|nr:O-antigen ligase family protein [Cellulosimicrobium composti]MTG90343.1 O-antigen ligase domain-containing protein [Cellulosimicrobium composti]